MAHFTAKEFEEDYDLLLGLAQILALLNLYGVETGLDCREYLAAPSTPEDKAAPRRAKKKAKLEDACMSDTIASRTLATALAMLGPYLLKKDISIGWHTKDKKYVLLYKGKALELKTVKEDDIASI